MKTKPINNTNFKALYVKDFDYNFPQQYTIQRIKDRLDNDNLSEIAAKGYDVFISNSSECSDEVEVSVIKNFNFTDECAQKECRKIKIGKFGAEELCSEFNVTDIHTGIDDYEKTLKKMNNFAKVMIGILLASATAIWAVGASKVIKSAETCNVKKATTELVQKTISCIA